VRAVKITKRKKARNSNRKVAIHAAASCFFLLPLQEGILRLELCSMQVQAVSKQPTWFQTKKKVYTIEHTTIAI
jgi:hypothetical protein